MEAILKAEGISYVYGKNTPFETLALDSVNIDINKGELVGIIGHTGSGKSTFIQHLNGLIKPNGGKILLNGTDINSSKENLRAAKFKVGLVFQYPEYQLFEETCFADISFGPKNMGLSESETKEKVEKAAKFAGVTDEMLEVSPLELSGGQKRRVAIAGVIAMEPEVLILDEPTAGLDPESRENILQRIIDYKNAQNASVILVSHSMDDIAKIADRLIVFHKGKIKMDGKPSEIFSRSKELEEIGLSVPVATQISEKLRESGVNLPEGIYTLEHLSEEILKIQGGAKC